MDKLLAQFIEEGRELIGNAGQGLLRLEKQPGDTDLLDNLFRDVHTLKGSAGVLELNPMVQVVHIAEEILELAKDQPSALDAEAIDELLEAMDLLNSWMDSLDSSEALPAEAGSQAEESAAALAAVRARFSGSGAAETDEEGASAESGEGVSWGLFDEPAAEAESGEGVAWGLFDDPAEPEAGEQNTPPDWMVSLDEAVLVETWDRLNAVNGRLYVIDFVPEGGCFFRGDDPLFLARQTPGLMAMDIALLASDEPPETQDVYQSRLHIGLLAVTTEDALNEHFQYEDGTLRWYAMPPEFLIQPLGDSVTVALDDEFVDDLDRLWSERRQDDAHDRIGAQLQLINQASRQASLLRWMQRLLHHRPDDAVLFDTVLQALRDPSAVLTEDGKIPWETVLPDAGRTSSGSEADDAPVAEPAPEQEEPSDAGDSPVVSELPGDAADIIRDQLKALRLCRESSMREGVMASVRRTAMQLAQSLGGRAPEAVNESVSADALEKSLEAWLQSTQGQGSSDAKPSGSAAASGAPPSHQRPEARESGEPAKAETIQGNKRPSKPRTESAAPVIRNFKVDQEQVEQLGDLVGELVVAKNALPFLAQRAEQVYQQRQLAREIREQFNVINRITSALQDAMMAVQMLPVSYVFDRFPRLVRDLSRKLDKSIELTISGEDTEAEKHVIESLADPLVHMMRNSIDHGIEPRETRAANGKPETGQISLSAWQHEEWVVIEVADDGGGIDPEKTKMKAYEKGLVDERRLKEMGDKEAIELIFAPGFSTIEEASDLSGRGVGMDVVRTTIEKAGGRIDVKSELGKGTRFRLYLPLSMSISQVMQIWIDGQRYGIPMDQVAETVRLPIDRVHQFKGRETVLLRDRVLSVCRARSQLGLEPEEDGQSVALLVVRHRDDLVALAVDDFSEGVEVILKPMEGALSTLGIYQGTALLGDGSVLLVLNPGVLLSTVTREEKANDHSGEG